MVGAGMLKPGTGEEQRVASLQQREGPPERLLRPVATVAPGFELGKLEPQLRAFRRDPQRLLDVGHPFLEGADVPGVRRGPRQVRHRLRVGAREPQLPGQLGGPRDRARLLAGEQHLRPAMVQPGPARLGDLLVDGVAQQRVPERHGVAGRHHQPGLERRRRCTLGIFKGKAAEFYGLDRPRRHCGDLHEAPSFVGQGSDRCPHRSAHAGRHVLPAPAERSRGLDRE